MRSWPTVYLPPAPSFVTHPNLQLKDSYSKEVSEINGSHVSSYVCGITPYDATHMGHAATYISFDLIHRYLLASGKKVDFVENVTDIDDPLLERAQRDRQDWKDLAVSQIELFRSDMTALRVIPPRSYAGVIENMDLIIENISRYISAGVTYEIDSDIYLNLTAIPEFPANLPSSFNEALAMFRERGGDPERSGKRNPLDPLLWRAKRYGEPEWSAPFGPGRPGWHVECSAIALGHLTDVGETSITIQGGGSDLSFPHHYMTAMQAQALTKKRFAAHYVHAGMIGLDGEKMSKSKGNLVFVSKLLSQGMRPEAIRMALIDGHYQSDRMWTDSLLTKANERIVRIERALARNEVAPTVPVINEIVNALSNNLDTLKVLEIIDDWCEATLREETGGVAGEMSRALDSYLGIAL